MLNQLQGELENDLMIQLDEDICEIRSVETGRIQDRSRMFKEDGKQRYCVWYLDCPPKTSLVQAFSS